MVEDLARNRVKQLFGAEHANVQPHSGSQANMAVYLTAVEPGDTVLGLDLAHGGHLTHGMKLNISGRLYHFHSYGVTRDTHRIDFDQVAALAREHRPKLIVAGASAYPREIPHGRFAEIAREVGAKLFVDMAHYAGLVAAGLHDNPVPVADFVTSTTHKTLRGPRAGVILCREEYAKDVDRNVFPGIQGGPLMHIIAGKAVCFGEALRPEFKQYAQADHRQRQGAGRGADGGRVEAGQRRHGQSPDAVRRDQPGPDRQEGRGGAGPLRHHGQQEHDPLRPRKPMDPSGIRIGTPALTTRGMGVEEMRRDRRLDPGGAEARRTMRGCDAACGARCWSCASIFRCRGLRRGSKAGASRRRKRGS